MTAAPPTTVTIVPNLDSFRRGDDLARLLKSGATPATALRTYEALLRADADRIGMIAAHLESLPEGQATMAAEGDYVGVTLPTRAADALLAQHVARREVERDEASERESRRRW